MRAPSLSIIVPCLNEAEGLSAALDALAPSRRRGAEVIVVDGGSADETLARAGGRADLLLPAPRGRAVQMNAGAKHARSDILLFLHADSRLPEGGDVLVREALGATGKSWGRFDVTICGQHVLFPAIAAAMNLRSRWTGIATGDQAIFVTRKLFEEVGGYPPIELMEDVAMSNMLKRHGWPLCIPDKVSTSGRRWEKHGALRTVLLMWRLRLAYRLGADVKELARQYVPNK